MERNTFLKNTAIWAMTFNPFNLARHQIPEENPDNIYAPINIFDFIPPAEHLDIKKGISKVDISCYVQKALKVSKAIVFPTGKYKFAKPVQLKGGEWIQGSNGYCPNMDSYSQTIIDCDTSAFVTENASEQKQSLKIDGIFFVNGTYQIDLGLFHLVDIQNCFFVDFSKVGISIIRGEKHRFDRLFFWSKTLNYEKGIALGSIQDSQFSSATNKTFEVWRAKLPKSYGTDGPWVDRVTMNDLGFQFGPGGNPGIGIFSDNILSHVIANNLLFHGCKTAGLLCRVLQGSILNNLIFDKCGDVNAKAKYGIGILKNLLDSELNNIKVTFSQNSHFDYPIYINDASSVVVTNPHAIKVNGGEFGFFIDSKSGTPNVQIIGGKIDLHHSSDSQIVKDRTQVLGTFLNSTDQTAAFSQTDQSNRGFTYTLMSDANGTKRTTSTWKIRRAVGNGTYTDNLAVGDNGLRSSIDISRLPWSMTLFNGSEQLSSIFSGLGDPEQKVAAPKGSLFLRSDGTQLNSIYIKESGTDSIGWNGLHNVLNKRVEVRDSYYQIKESDVLIAIVAISNKITLALPLASKVKGQYFIIKDESGQGKDKVSFEGIIDGMINTIAIENNYSSKKVYSNGIAYFSI